VHECYLRLNKGGLPEVSGRSHFFAMVSRIMRQILVDFARSRLAQRRDKRLEKPIGDAQTIRDEGAQRMPMLLEMDDQLRELEKVAPEAARLVELRFFGGLTAEEAAEYLEMDVGRVRRQLRYGQGWLRRALQNG
jgi:RNA polymerase sigma factor (TIGR02999 family)